MIKPIHRFIAWKTRKAFGSGDKKRDADQTTPPDIIRFDNIVYGDDKKLKKWQLLDVYRPKNLDNENTSTSFSTNSTNNAQSLEKLPVIVSVHGGAWVYGDKDVYQFYCMRLAQRGFAVVNFSYRLAPEAVFPSSLEDTDKVFNWIEANAEKYGFDIDNVFAVGDSAGAHLLCLYASALSNADYAKNYPFINSKKLMLRGIALNCGKYDMTPTAEDTSMVMLLEALLGQKITDEKLNLINANAHITKDFPPTFVMTCLGDFLYPQAEVINKSLETAGVKYEYHCYGTKEMPLWHVFHCDPHLPQAVECNDDECAFFRSVGYNLKK